MGCEGEPIELQDYLPPELQALRKKIAGYTGGKLGEAATPLPEGFPLAAPTNQLQLNAAQLMNQLMGGGDFGMPPYRTMGGNYAQGGGAGGAGGGGGVSPRGTGGPLPPGNPFAQVGYLGRNTYSNFPPDFPMQGSIGAGGPPSPGVPGSPNQPPANNPWLDMLRQRMSRYLPQGYNG